MNRSPLIVIGLTLALGACVSVSRDSSTAGVDATGGAGGDASADTAAAPDVPPCEEGTKRCVTVDTDRDSTDELQRCTDGAWVAAQVCDWNEVCVGQGEKCRPAQGEATCTEIIDCANADNCGDDEACYADCFYDGSEAAQGQYATFFNCMKEEGCADIEGTDHYGLASCLVVGNCDAPASDCFIGKAGVGGCGDITLCVGQTCLPLRDQGEEIITACLLTCTEQGSAEAQTWFLILQQCITDTCDTDFPTCVAQALNDPADPCAPFGAQCTPPGIGPGG